MLEDLLNGGRPSSTFIVETQDGDTWQARWARVQDLPLAAPTLRKGDEQLVLMVAELSESHSWTRWPFYVTQRAFMQGDGRLHSRVTGTDMVHFYSAASFTPMQRLNVHERWTLSDATLRRGDLLVAMDTALSSLE